MTGQAMPKADHAAAASASPQSLTPPPQIEAFQSRVTPYACWALALLFLTNLFNYIDRHVVAVVATSIARDLHLSDADLGFLMGTAFATLYGIFGVGMGRIADSISRTRLLGSGLIIWSGMTAASGMAFNFVSLASARVGVGIGEAIASPCSQSLISDYFPARNRSLAMGIYLAAAPLGGAAAMVIGGAIMQNWATTCATLPGTLCRLSDWQATFLVMGLPGIILAAIVLALREPRPRRQVLPTRRIVIRELSSTVPPLTFINLFTAGGAQAIRRNLVLIAGIAAVALSIAALTGDWLQWIAIGIGAVSLASWGQLLRMSDRPLYRLTFGSRTAVYAIIGAALTGTFSVTFGAWSMPFAIRELGASKAQIGAFLGFAGLVASVSSALIGGIVNDKWKRRDPRAPVWMALVSMIGPVIPLIVMLQTKSLMTFAVGFFFFQFLALAWTGAFAAYIQDSVLPRMRATAAAIFALVVMLVSLGIGPYAVGKVSQLTGSLTTGVYSLLVLIPLGTPFLIAAARRVGRETPELRAAWAVEAGEDISTL
ncbi:MFS transporter [Novosphingobium bradum]|uniref:MFS transporter n=1 Tax=Novosphingobium bradum TaxID=1737444 RepID=A0ABV7IUH3_9SPHN